jgi:hypothetical protein
MKATETKSTHSQQHGAADKSSASQEQERAFFSESTFERSPFFNPAGGVGVQAKVGNDRPSFFQPARVPAVQMKCAACEAEEREQAGELDSEMPTVQRMPAFESDEADVQRQPISGNALPLIQRMPAFESDEDITETGEETIQRKVAAGVSEIASTAATLQPKCEACEAEEEEKREEPTEETPQMQMMAASGNAEDSGDENDTSVQFSLKVGRLGDTFEREADAMAERVVHTPLPASTPQVQTQRLSDAEHPIQRTVDFPPIPDLEKERTEPAPEPVTGVPSGQAPAPPAPPGVAAGGAGAKVNLQLPEAEPLEKEEPPPIQARLQDGEIDNAPAIQAQSTGSSTGASKLQDTLSNSKATGSPMAPDVQADMEQHFGKDLSPVRIHTDSSSVQMNRDLNARAFTHENSIYFNAGEYQPESQSGKYLLAHELTHTVQQGAVSDTIQRTPRPEQSVTLEPRPERPNDGAEVEGRMNERIDNDPDVQNPEDLSEEERREAQNPDRGEVRQESSAISNSGQSRPEVDRGAIAQQTTETQQAQIDEQVQEQPAEATEEAAAPAEGEAPVPSDADAAAQRSLAAEQQARAVSVPEEPEPFQHPRIEAPVDSVGQPLPRNSQIDTQVRGLAYIGEMLREKGYEMKRHAAEQEMGAYGHDAVVERLREDLANAQEGTATMEAHNESRREIAQQSREAHAESVERQQFVAEKAPDLASRADEGRADSSELASEARSKADRSQREIPDDPDARADAEQQSSEMRNSAEGAESMDQAIRQTGERARQYQQDAEAAAEQNVQSEAQITETDEIIAQTDTRIAEMQATNEASQTQIEAAAPGPALIRRHAQQTDRSGDELIAATMVMEDELNALQEQYLRDMRGIESREAAMERQRREQEQGEVKLRKCRPKSNSW